MQLDFERYECKYIIPAGLRGPIKDFIACYTRPDKYTALNPDGGYLITSLYLDTPYLTFHLAKSRKDLNRFKLRIRIYDDQIDGPVFFEIKRKIKGIIHKRRVMIRRTDWVLVPMVFTPRATRTTPSGFSGGPTRTATYLSMRATVPDHRVLVPQPFLSASWISTRSW